MKMSVSLLIVVTAVVVASTATGSIPTKMSFQGFLTDGGGNPLSGTYDLTFKLYDSSAGGTLLWSESHAGVSVGGGVFDVVLGDQGSPLDPDDFEAPLWLGIQVDADPELPRVEVTSSAFSMNSQHGGGWTDNGSGVQLKPGRLQVVISGNLEVQGNTNLTSDVNVTGNLTGAGNAIFNGTLDAGSSITAVGNLYGQNDLILTGDANIAGGVAAAGDIESAMGVRMGNSSSVLDGTVRYTGIDFEGRKGGTWVSLTSPGATGNTLDGAYDQGGAGVGRTIIADAGPVHVTGPDGLEVDGYSNFGSGVNVTANLTGTGNAIFAGNLDAGSSITAVGNLYGQNDLILTGDANIGGGVAAAGEIESGVGVRMGNSISVLDGTVRYTGTDFEGRKSGTWVSLTATGTGNTLDDAYDQGGPGAGATITADSGPVSIAGPSGLSVTGPTSVNNNFYATGDIGAGGFLDVGSALTVNGDINANQDVLVIGDLTLPAGSVGIGTLAPQEQLEVAGAVKLGTTIGTNDGTIRYTGTDFEGRKSGAWVSLTATAAGNTLDDAYDQGGPGAGATITADSGPVTIAGTDGLNVAGSAAVIGDVSADGDITAGLDLNVNGSASVAGSIVTGGSITPGGDIVLSGSSITDVGTQVQVDDDLLVTGTMSSLGDAAVVGNLSTDGDITAGLDLSVNGSASVAGSIVTAGGITAGGNIGLSGGTISDVGTEVQVDDDLLVTGDATANGNVTVGADINVAESVANTGTPISIENCTSSTSFVQLTTFDLPSQPSDRLMFMNIAFTAKGTSAGQTAVFIVRGFCYGTATTTDLADHYGSAPLLGALDIRNDVYSTYELNLGPFPASTGQRWRFIVYYRSRNASYQACINNLTWEARSLRYEY